MSETTDNNFIRLYGVLDKITESLSELSKEREEQQKSISNIAQLVESKNTIVNERCNKLEKTIRTTETNINTDLTKIRLENRTTQITFTKKITDLELQIKQIEESMRLLQAKHDENVLLINELRPKVGKKRKWWQVI
jgi:hypothetical protein